MLCMFAPDNECLGNSRDDVAARTPRSSTKLFLELLCTDGHSEVDGTSDCWVRLLGQPPSGTDGLFPQPRLVLQLLLCHTLGRTLRNVVRRDEAPRGPRELSVLVWCQHTSFPQ